METDRLIRTLAADGAPRGMSMSRMWSLTALAAAAIAAAVFFMSIGPRGDIADAAHTIRFLFKFVVTLALFATAFAALRGLAIPGVNPARAMAPLVLAPALLLIAVGLELLAIPPSQIESRWIGSNALICMTFIPMIGIGPLAAFLFALRNGAPTRPSLAGAVSGLVAGGLSATFYAAHCTDDSPLFVATFYPLAVAILVVAGAVAGRFVARW
ncbi:MAG: NrsF family protein [Rhizobiaceae bacterium]